MIVSTLSTYTSSSYYDTYISKAQDKFRNWTIS